jgi:hypothetical protein
MRAMCVLWVSVHPDYKPLFSFLDGLRADDERRYWISEQSIELNTCDMGEDMRHKGIEVKITLSMSHKTLTRDEELVK